jgi:hypothetical protein
MLMVGNSMAHDTEHGRAVNAQLTRRSRTLEEAIEAANFALAAADIPRGIRRQARAAAEDYFYNRLGLKPEFEPPRVRALGGGLELLSDPMYKALEDVVELVVDGEWEDLRELSHNTLAEEDLRRRVEDECPEALVLPPREIYRVEALTVIDEPDQEGWTFFLELWTDDGPAILHLEGELQETQGAGFEVTLRDVLP